jgi:hypothetical protein
MYIVCLVEIYARVSLCRGLSEDGEHNAETCRTACVCEDKFLIHFMYCKFICWYYINYSLNACNGQYYVTLSVVNIDSFCSELSTVTKNLENQYAGF